MQFIDIQTPIYRRLLNLWLCAENNTDCAVVVYYTIFTFTLIFTFTFAFIFTFTELK